jgi:hypothetical protein
MFCLESSYLHNTFAEFFNEALSKEVLKVKLLFFKLSHSFKSTTKDISHDSSIVTLENLYTAILVEEEDPFCTDHDKVASNSSPAAFIFNVSIAVVGSIADSTVTPKSFNLIDSGMVIFHLPITISDAQAAASILSDNFVLVTSILPPLNV